MEGFGGVWRRGEGGGGGERGRGFREGGWGSPEVGGPHRKGSLKRFCTMADLWFRIIAHKPDGTTEVVFNERCSIWIASSVLRTFQDNPANEGTCLALEPYMVLIIDNNNNAQGPEEAP